MASHPLRLVEQREGQVRHHQEVVSRGEDPSKVRQMLGPHGGSSYEEGKVQSTIEKASPM